jgi:hypothetical protein
MPKTVADLLRERRGIRTTPFVNRSVTQVGITAVQLVRQDPNRPSFLVVNLSVNDFYMGPFQDVSATKGIRQTPSGGNVFIWWEEDGMVVTREWWVVATGAASPIMVIEDIIQPD